MEANLYIQEKFEKGLSRKDRGGTLHTYATEISALIKFCYDKGTDFIDLCDEDFSAFVRALSSSKDKNGGGTKRKPRRVRRVAGRCLEFLSTVGELHQRDDFLGPCGRIRAVLHTTRIKNDRGNREIQRAHWRHNSFPTDEGGRKRLPISAQNIQLLRNAVLECSSSIFIRKRRYAMIAALEATGARRYEIVHLRVDDVLNALSMERPMLRLVTAKRGGNLVVTREVPISSTDLNILVEFITKNRRRIVQKKFGKAKDDGFVFISETTGNKLSTNTLTQEIYILRTHAGIEEQACAHMFRHAFITRQFAALCEHYRIQNMEDFRRSLLDIEAFKIAIQEMIGQRSVESLRPYIHIALDSNKKAARIIEKARAANALKTFESRIEQIAQDLPNLSNKQAVEELRRAIAAGLKDTESL